jgi:hypothetical protein
VRIKRQTQIEKEKLLIIEAGGTYIYPWALKGPFHGMGELGGS